MLKHVTFFVLKIFASNSVPFFPVAPAFINFIVATLVSNTLSSNDFFFGGCTKWCLAFITSTTSLISIHPESSSVTNTSYSFASLSDILLISLGFKPCFGQTSMNFPTHSFLHSFRVIILTPLNVPFFSSIWSTLINRFFSFTLTHAPTLTITAPASATGPPSSSRYASLNFIVVNTNATLPVVAPAFTIFVSNSSFIVGQRQLPSVDNVSYTSSGMVSSPPFFFVVVVVLVISVVSLLLSSSSSSSSSLSSFSSLSIRFPSCFIHSFSMSDSFFIFSSFVSSTLIIFSVHLVAFGTSRVSFFSFGKSMMPNCLSNS